MGSIVELPRRASSSRTAARGTAEIVIFPGVQIERREIDPSSIAFAAGATEHLVAVSLGSGRITRELMEKTETAILVPGSVALQPCSVPMRWSWDTRLSLTLLALDPGYA